jgi:hypothetical protein
MFFIFQFYISSFVFQFYYTSKQIPHKWGPRFTKHKIAHAHTKPVHSDLTAIKTTKTLTMGKQADIQIIRWYEMLTASDWQEADDI